jgi:hypothetical protein
MLKQTTRSQVGEFKLTSTTLRVTDPCYGMQSHEGGEIWCAGSIQNVRPGTWKAQVGFWDDPFDMELKVRSLNNLSSMADDWDARIEEHIKEFQDRFGVTLTKENNPYRSDLSKVEHLKAELPPARTAYIMVCHERLDIEALTPAQFEEVEGIHVGVDSGQAGFFDLDQYAAMTVDKNDEENPIFNAFYKSVCNQNVSDEKDSLGYAIVPFGAASCSGQGDGGYTCFQKVDDGLVTAAFILFIDPDDEF